METILGLTYTAVWVVVITVVLHLLTKKTVFGKCSYKTKQIAYGLVYGILAIICVEFSVDIGGASASSRDGPVMVAGIVFGVPAGIIASVIGALARFFSVYVEGGVITRYSSSISTLVAGLFAIFIRKLVFDDKTPPIAYSFIIAIVAEVLHMLQVLVVNRADNTIEFGFHVVKCCAIPMISVNSLTVLFSVLFTNILEKCNFFYTAKNKEITRVVQRWILLCGVLAFLITCVFTTFLQFKISKSKINNLLTLNIRDTAKDISDTFGRKLLGLAEEVAKEIPQNKNLIELSDKYSVPEISLVDKDGIIVDSTNKEFIGYDMRIGEQSAKFLKLLRDEKSYVQKYQSISINTNLFRKIAGVALESGGFVQVGYDPEYFKSDVAREIVNLTSNRHIGKTGKIFITDEDFRYISNQQEYNGKINIDIVNLIYDFAEEEPCIYTINGESSYCMYKVCEGYYVIGVYPISEALFERDISIYLVIFMEIIILFVLVILIYTLIKTLVIDNIKSVNNSLAKITEGNLDVVVNVRSNKEFASLSDDINATVKTLKQYIAEASARIDKELENAKVIQESLLPSVVSPFPNIKNLDIYASMQAAKEVGGDFYDFYLIDPTHLLFLVADVSGKGITGAMFMMRAKTIIKSFASATADVSKILANANNAICEGNDAEMFVTCFMGILDLKNFKIEFANAGHNPPIVRYKDGSFVCLKGRPDFVLGGMEGMNYKKHEISFAPGDTIFLYTDGITEAVDLQNNLYGTERLLAALNSSQKQNTQGLCQLVKDDVDYFVGKASQFDDMTMLCLRLQI